MLPVALTCPLWWVARWATRVLTSLAVLAALALGAGPASAAVPSPSAVPTSSAVSAPSALSAPSAVPSSFVPGSLVASCRPASPEGAVHPAQAVRVGVVEESSPAGSVGSKPAPPAGVGAAATDVLPVCAAGADRLPLVDGPRGWAPRGPPGR
ncbi:hypothetical protein [Micromonospora parathelypteridis]|uniref:Secreted protein n=1 Tax=Micromonospora parathelypteridis TaxID=1839617 RepID=A0A840VUB9_9ACTN|nr:hypothetical protein [Micromonospora parathelypteridis]MBB5480217.1 hypothetical protein [Micromonospora parathelypteridis]GGO24390.1 hypothetical protein GCM10011576_45900 [Micromonospora parathelypteridis]